ncbi:MAG: sigma 54-interacting transcriptional regulator [Anaerolineaceae bacterium]|nr:sigma 54-interacting transcriptional regulator [Anaerolineaceae bacterium]
MSHGKEQAGSGEDEGVTANEVADALGLWRNDCSMELKKLVEEGKLIRSGKKNIRFYLKREETVDGNEANASEVPGISLENLGSQESSAFSRLVGANGSLKHQINVAKAAALYPSNGLNMLVTGPTGAGKSRFAQAVWEYAKEVNAFNSKDGDIPFIHFNCAEYADNPQLLMAILFGYKKGAFTGAFTDKAGLVEEANGGILLLDEIHCLSSTGQELFFTLLDTGHFRRIGENEKRESHFMIIGATTKPVTDTLLDTFLRRMPLLIQIPNLAERPMKERQDFIEYFYAEEAKRIGHPLCIKKDVLNTLLDYTFHANLGTLKNAIQISCAKGYLQSTSRGEKNGEITISFSDLSFQSVLQEVQGTEEALYRSIRFSSDLYISAEVHVSPDAQIPSFIDIYDFVKKRLDVGIKAGLGYDLLQQMIPLEVDNYYQDLNRALSESGTDMELLNSVVLPGIIQISAEFLGLASKELNRTYSPSAPLLLAMHLSQYVNRVRSEFPVFPAEFRNIVKKSNEDILFLEKTRDWLSSLLKVNITDDEINFLAVVLSQVSDEQPTPEIWITLVSHTNTASSIGAFANSVYSSKHIHWVDGSSADDMHKMFVNICNSIKTFHGKNGNLIFTDMDVLSSLEYEIYKETGVHCKVVTALEQRLIMDACKVTVASECGLEEANKRIIRNYGESMLRFFESANVDVLPKSAAHEEMPTDKIVLTVCVTGVGSAQSIKKVLQRKLSYIKDLSVVAMSSLEDIKGKATEYGSALKLIIGTVNPNIPDVPFVSADRVFTASGMYCISSILDDGNFNIYETNFDAEESKGDELDSILNDMFNFIAPSVDQNSAVVCINKIVYSLETEVYRKPLADNVRARLFIHTASMLERIVNNRTLQIDDEEEATIQENEEWFNLLERIINESCLPSGYDIPRGEDFFFMLSLPEIDKRTS